MNRRISVTIILTVLLLLPGFSSSAAQEVSVLQKGPIFRKGIPFLPPNALPVFYGVYSFRDSEIIVYFSESLIPRAEDWEEIPCQGGTLLQLPGREIFIFPDTIETEWSIFIVFKESISDICPFVNTFLRRFQYFLGITRDRSIPPFPAVLVLE